MGQDQSQRELLLKEHGELMALLTEEKWEEAEAALKRHLEHVAYAVLKALGNL